MAETTVADGQLAAFIDRILRMKDEADAIGEDIKEIYAEAKANGFDKTQLGNVVNYLRKKDKNSEKVEEAETIFDLYLGSYLTTKKMAPHVRAHRHTREDAQNDSEVAFDAWAEQVADRVDPELLKTLIEGSKTEAGRKIILGAIEEVKAGNRVAALKADPSLAIVSAADLKSEPQPAPAARDLTVPQALTGQVATHPVANVEEDANGRAVASDDEASREVDDADRQRVVASGITGEREPGSAEPVAAAQDRAPLYAAPGVVTWELAPPEGVKRHEYSYAFSDLGQDAVVIEEDMRNAASELIVKIGADILDGWARYNKARSIGIEYPVVQYAGTDPLMDCIRWNLAGRIMADLHKRTVAQRLARINPGRRDEIYAAMELGMELVA